METLKEIINILKIIGVSMAGITFVIFMIKIATEPEMKSKYLKLNVTIKSFSVRLNTRKSYIVGESGNS